MKGPVVVVHEVREIRVSRITQLRKSSRVREIVPQKRGLAPFSGTWEGKQLTTTVGAIDIGTNSTRLLIARIAPDGRLDVVHTALTTTRLGENLAGGVLLDRAMDRTINCLAEYQAVSAEYGPDGMVVAATAAVREAANRDEFVKRVLDAVGFEVRVLSGTEEAAYGFLGVVSGLDLDPAGILVADVGGGSTEFVWLEEGSPACRSLPVGAVRMTETPYTDTEITALIRPLLTDERRGLGVRQLVGVGGTVTTLAAMALALEVYDPERVHGTRLNQATVEELLLRLETAGPAERKQMPGLQPERADIIPAGARIVRCIMRILAAPDLIVSEADILHGLARYGPQAVERKTEQAILK